MTAHDLPPVTALYVTALYVPGDRPDRFTKAVASGADMVILDLEDAVSDERKQVARDAVCGWLTDRASFGEVRPVIQVRVNRDEPEDLAALGGIRSPIELRVPKVESPGDIDAVLGTIDRPLTALIETALGVQNAADIAGHPAVTSIALGDADLASDLGSDSQAALDYARLQILFAARAAGLPAPMMSAYPLIRDLTGLRSDTEHGRSLGLIGRTAVHPSQLRTIWEVFSPKEADIAWARSVLEATSDGGVATLSTGEMVDKAMVGRARRTLRLAESASRFDI